MSRPNRASEWRGTHCTRRRLSGPNRNVDSEEFLSQTKTVFFGSTSEDDSDIGQIKPHAAKNSEMQPEPTQFPDRIFHQALFTCVVCRTKLTPMQSGPLRLSFPPHFLQFSTPWGTVTVPTGKKPTITQTRGNGTAAAPAQRPLYLTLLL